MGLPTSQAVALNRKCTTYVSMTAAETNTAKVPNFPIFKALENMAKSNMKKCLKSSTWELVSCSVKPENVERVKELLDEPVYEIGRIVNKDGASVGLNNGVISPFYTETERSV